MDSDLSRKGPGLMLRALTDRPDDQATAVIAVLAHADADVLVLGGVDFDYALAGMHALRDRLADAGLPYPHIAAASPVSGRPSGVDVDDDGRLGEPEDAMGYGWFRGDSGLVVFSRYPLGEIEDFSTLLWADLPGSAAPDVLNAQAAAVVPLASTVMWRVPVEVSDTAFDLLAFTASPPVFDGPEDRNGLRNRDQLRFWTQKLDDGAFERPVLAGRFNVDPFDGEGHRDALTALLTHPRLHDPAPESAGGAAFAPAIANAGPPAQDTAAWTRAPGPLRVDYVLPARAWEVLATGVLWPTEGPLAETIREAGPNRLVWVELRRAP